MASFTEAVCSLSSNGRLLPLGVLSRTNDDSPDRGLKRIEISRLYNREFPIIGFILVKEQLSHILVALEIGAPGNGAIRSHGRPG
jgi:hypothetical protein